MRLFANCMYVVHLTILEKCFKCHAIFIVGKVNGIGVERHLAYIYIICLLLLMQFMLNKLSIIIVEYKMNALKRLNNFTGYSFRIKNAIETTTTKIAII